MIRKAFLFVLVMGMFALLANAGTLQGKSAGSQVGVVFVNKIAGKTFPASTLPQEVDQQGQSFRPSVLVVPQGTTVVFKNSDTVAHNVRWPSIAGNKQLAHSLGTWASGDNRSFKFENPGVIPLLCNMHAEMKGFIIVVATPYYSYTAPGGDYTIRNVPDGKYTVTSWHPDKPVETRQVTVAGNTTLNF